MRVKHSLVNISVGLLNQMVITILSFLSRTVFINSLGIEYLGINGLLTNVIGILTLVEAGIGSSIMYSLYKPVSENDIVRINMLMNFYRKAYRLISAIVLILGLALMPFLNVIIKDSSIDNFYLIYFIFLINTVLPYLYVYRNSYLNVCQKNYVVTGIYSVSSIIATIIKVIILYKTNNYIFYLLIDSIFIIISSIVIMIVTNKMYPYLKDKVTNSLDSETRKNITINIKAIIIQNFGNYLIVGTDNIIISSFVSVVAVGIYSNYYMLIEICRSFVNQISNNIYHSIGNLVANENTNNVYNFYKVYRLMNFWIYSIVSIVLILLIGPFLTVWLGVEYLLHNNILIVLIILFFERGMRNTVSIIKSTSGVFHEDRYIPLCQAIINVIVSVILVQKIGLIGVFLGTLISVGALPFWNTPYIVYKKIFKKSLVNYFKNYIIFSFIGIMAFFLTYMSINYISLEGLAGILLKLSVSIIIPNIIYYFIFRNTTEFQYLIKVGKMLFQIINGKLIRKKSVLNI